jgi:hypothetical protein
VCRLRVFVADEIRFRLFGEKGRAPRECRRADAREILQCIAAGEGSGIFFESTKEHQSHESEAERKLAVHLARGWP